MSLNLLVRRRHRRPRRRRAEAPLHRQGRHPDPHVCPAWHPNIDHGELIMKRLATRPRPDRPAWRRPRRPPNSRRSRPTRAPSPSATSRWASPMDGKFRRSPPVEFRSGQAGRRPRRPSTSTWPASTPARRKATRKSPARPGSTPGLPDRALRLEQRQGARRQPLRSHRPADHQGQDAGHRRPRHLHGAGQQRRLRRQLHHPPRRFRDRRRRLGRVRRRRQRSPDQVPHHRQQASNPDPIHRTGESP